MLQFMSVTKIEDFTKYVENQSKLYDMYADTISNLHTEWDKEMDTMLSEYKMKIRESDDQLVDSLVDEMIKKNSEIANKYILQIKEYLELLDKLDVIDIKGIKINKSFYLNYTNKNIEKGGIHT